MHIVFLTSEYPKKGFPHGGVGTVVQNIARGLIEKEHQVSVIGLNYNKSHEVSDDKGVKIYRLSRKELKPLTWFFNSKIINSAIIDIHQKQPIDIIESAELGFAFIKKIERVKYLIRLHGGHHFFAESEKRKLNIWKAYQERQSFKKADHVVGVSEYVVNHTLKYINFRNKFECVIYNIANLGRFQPSNNIKEIKGRIFFAGSLCEKKGIRQLIKSIPEVIKSLPEAHLVVAGRDTIMRGTQESYLKYLKTEIDDEIKNKIKFLGVVENTNLSKEMEKAEVCVYPSHMETFGMSCVESLAMGKSVINSSLGPGTEIVIHRKTGLICNPFEIENLSQQIIQLLEDRDYAHKLGRNAIEDVNHRFSYQNLMKKNIRLYESLI